MGLLLIGNSHYVRIFLVIGLLPFNCAYYTTNKNIKTYLFAKMKDFFNFFFEYAPKYFYLSQ